MEEHRKRLEKRLLDEDDERIAKLATKIKHDNFLFIASLIWLAVCIVVSLYLIVIS
jgi:hypothetical protein